MKKGKSFLIVPTAGKQPRAITVRWWYFALVLVFVITGIAGLLMPEDFLSVKPQEQHYSKNLARQNQNVLKDIVALRQNALELRQQVEQLSASAMILDSVVSPLIDTESVARISHGKRSSGLSMQTRAMVIDQISSYYRTVLSQLADNPDLFNHVPILHPVPSHPEITREFGKVTDPFTGYVKPHYGIDFSAPIATPVLATAEGKVLSADFDPHMGHTVVLEHAKGIKTIYAHLDKSNVRRGQRVTRAQVIGTVGNSGISSGPHLHYEILRGDTPINPRSFLFHANRVVTQQVVQAE